MKKIVIIGGGISGLCTAYYLTKEGHSVSIIDKNDITSGVSFINAGYITPSHFISLAAPGMITKGIKWMFNSASPFYVKPRLDLDFFKWVLHFGKAATLDQVERSVPVIKEINLKSRALYEEMLTSVDFDFHYEHKGLLMAYRTEKCAEEELGVAERAVKEGLEARQLNKEELDKMQPGFSDQVLGAIYYECDSHMTPGKFMLNLKTWLKEHGVEFHLKQEVKEVKTFKNSIVSVETDERSFEADEFILATGSWTSSLAKSLGLNIPVQGGKGYSMDIHRPTGINMPTILVDGKVAVTPMDGFVRFAGTMEFSGNNSQIRPKRVEAIANSVKNFYKEVELTAEEKSLAVSGLRPVSPDGLPYIGRTSSYKNLIVASGHAMMGWSLGPITGKLITEIISDKATSVDMKPFGVDRYN